MDDLNYQVSVHKLGDEYKALVYERVGGVYSILASGTGPDRLAAIDDLKLDNPHPRLTQALGHLRLYAEREENQ